MFGGRHGVTARPTTARIAAIGLVSWGRMAAVSDCRVLCLIRICKLSRLTLLAMGRLGGRVAMTPLAAGVHGRPTRAEADHAEKRDRGKKG